MSGVAAHARAVVHLKLVPALNALMRTACQSSSIIHNRVIRTIVPDR